MAPGSGSCLSSFFYNKRASSKGSTFWIKNNRLPTTHFAEKENRSSASVTVAHGLVIYQLGRSTGQESSAKAVKSLLSSIHTTLLHFLVSLKFKQRCRSSQRGKMRLSSICRFQAGLQRDTTEAPGAGRFLLQVPLLRRNPFAFPRALGQAGEHRLCPKLQSC